MKRKRLAILAVVVVAVLTGWFIFLRETSVPQALAPAVPSCILDGGRPFTTLTLTLCMPPDAAMTTKPSADLGITTVIIPSVAEPLTIVTGPYLLLEKSDEVFGPPIMERIQEKPVISNSLCREFRVVDVRWKRADGWQAREIASNGVAAGYRWSPPNVAEALDRVLDKTHCRYPGVASAR